MTSADRAAVVDQLLDHEGEVLHAYADSEGYLTIGVGHMVDERRGGRISRAASRFILDEDIRACLDDLMAFGWFAALDGVRQRALIDMRFNLGPAGFRGFRKMIAALERRDFETADREAMDSTWARQVQPRRRDRVRRQLRTGTDGRV